MHDDQVAQREADRVGMSFALGTIRAGRRNRFAIRRDAQGTPRTVRISGFSRNHLYRFLQSVGHNTNPDRSIRRERGKMSVQVIHRRHLALIHGDQ